MTSTGGVGGQPAAANQTTLSGATPAAGHWGDTPTAGQGGTGEDGCSTGGDGQDGGIRVFAQMVAPSSPSGTPTVSSTASNTITVSGYGSVTDAWPSVTGYTATCTSTTAGATTPVTGSVTSATSTPITVAGATAGASYTCSVKARNGEFSLASGTSAAVSVIGPPWIASGAQGPTASGSVAYTEPGAQVLTGTTGSWSTPSGAGNEITGYTYLWQALPECSGSTWGDAAGSTKDQLNYTIVAADAGDCLRLTVSATNVFGTSSPVASTATAQVTAPPVFTAETPPEVADEGYFAGYTFVASGYAMTYTEVATAPLTGLPAGMSINGSTGAIDGDPNAGTATPNDGVYTYKVKAANASGEVTTSTLTLTVSDGTPNSITVATQPVGGASGAALATQPAVQLKDSSGRFIAQPLSVAVTASGGTLTGTSPVTTSNGVATFSLTMAGLVNTDYTLTFTYGALSATSSAFRVTPGALATITVLTQPMAAAAAGDVLTTQPVVQLADAQGNVINDRSSSVTVSSVLSSSTSTAAGAVGGTTTVSTSTGVASFTDLTFGGTVGTLYKLKFTSGAVSALSTTDVSNTQAGAAAKLSVQTEPTLAASKIVGDSFTTQPIVQILDAGDNLTTSTATVTATPSSGTLGGTDSVAGVSGTATFTDLTFAGLVSTNYTLTFTSPGLTSATSSTFQFAAGQFGPVSVVTTSISASPSSVAADGAMTSTIIVQAKDAGGNNLTASQGTVTLSATDGTLSAVTDNNNGTYTATFTAPAARGTGTATISGTLAGSALTETADITLKTTQTITFAQPANVPLGTLPYQLTATASSGLSLAFSLGSGTTNSECTVSPGGIVTINAVGTCEIDADQTGDSIYWAATQVTQSFLVTATTPTAPYITSVTEANGSASVAFTAPGFDGGAAISNYQYTLDGGTTWTALSPVDPTTPITIPSLTNGTAYSVAIRAVNSAGTGLASNTSGTFTPASSGGTTVTTAATTPSAPRNAQVTAEPSTTATVAWQEPSSNGGAAITSYTVTVSPSGTCTASIASTSRNGSCTIAGLTPGVTYTFTISAVNSVGAGTETSVSYTVPGGSGGGGTGGGGGGGGGTDSDDPTDTDDPTDPNGPGTDSDDDDPRRDGPGTNGQPLPPRFPTPDGPGRDAERKLNGSPTTKDVKDIPTAGVLTGSGPVPATGWVPPTGVGPDDLYAVGNGVRALDPQSERVQQLQASGVNLTVIRSPGTEKYMTTWKFTVEPNSMLQVVMPVEPATLNVPFALWIQDRLGAWTSVGATTVVDGQVVMPILLFEKAGVYQVVATSIDSAARVRAKDVTPTWGRTTIRTIVTVSAKDVLGTTLCPNMVGFGAESATLSKGDKQLLRRLATCLGATPKVTITGYVHAVTNPKVAKQVALDRAAAVKKYLRDRGYNGRVILDQSIVASPRECRPVEGRCAIVEIKVGDSRGRAAAVIQEVTAPAAESAPASDEAQVVPVPIEQGPSDPAPMDAGQFVTEAAPSPAAPEAPTETLTT